MKSILFITNHRKERSPNQRFRFEQYLDYLEDNGFKCEVSYIITPEDDKIIYSKGNYFKKAKFAIKSLWQRYKDLKRANQFDIIFVCREAHLMGTTFFEKGVSKSKAKLVFDFDDAIWISDVSSFNKVLKFLKNPDKTKEIIRLSDMVFAGNQYLANYAKDYSDNIKIVPTTIDTEEYKPVEGVRTPYQICIGWSGSITTIKHFETALPYLKRIKAKYGDKVCFKVIGDGSYVNEELGIQGLPWKKEGEVKELSSIDIGIMPLPNDNWAEGKCGLKGLQYMALEIATIMSPIGVNTEIITEGVDGFLAETEDEWVDKLEQLIESTELRIKISKAGRQTIIDKYSKESQKAYYLKYFNEL